MAKRLVLALALAALLAGCKGSDDKAGVKVQEGDYSGPPGGAQQAKPPAGG